MKKRKEKNQEIKQENKKSKKEDYQNRFHQNPHRIINQNIVEGKKTNTVAQILQNHKVNTYTLSTALLNNPDDLNKILPNGETPLHYAIRRGDLAYIQTLLFRGADVNKVDDFGYTPLHIAVLTNFENTVDIIELLLEKEAVIKEREPMKWKVKVDDKIIEKHDIESTGLTPLHLIFTKTPFTRKDILVWLEKDPADEEVEVWLSNKFEILECFFKRRGKELKESINKQDRNGRTLLHHAVLGTNFQKEELIAYLICRGADINIKDKPRKDKSGNDIPGETPQELQDRLIKSDKFLMKDQEVSKDNVSTDNNSTIKYFSDFRNESGYQRAYQATDPKKKFYKELAESGDKEAKKKSDKKLTKSNKDNQHAQATLEARKKFQKELDKNQANLLINQPSSSTQTMIQPETLFEESPSLPSEPPTELPDTELESLLSETATLSHFLEQILAPPAPR